MTFGSSNSWSFYTGNRLTFGRGALKCLPQITMRLKCQRVLLVTDKNLVSLGLADRVTEALAPSNVTVSVFDGSTVEPSTEHAASLLDLAKDFQPDVWVALGGGSNMDLAKLACAAHSHAMAPAEVFGVDNIPGPTQPLICIPTTAGTGSEVSHASIIKNGIDGPKSPVLSQYIRPAYAVVAPELTDACPKNVCAESGIDALTHAMEAYLATSYTEFIDQDASGLPYEGNNSMGDLYAEKAIALIGTSLRRAVNEPADLVAKDNMALAATLAGVAFSNCGVTLAHALEYWLGSRYTCSHGAGNGILLPEVLRFYLPQRASRLAYLHSLLTTGRPSTGNLEPDQHDLEALAEATIAEVTSLRSDIGLPASLQAIGAPPEELSDIAHSASKLERLLALAPRPASEADLLQILKNCYR